MLGVEEALGFEDVFVFAEAEAEVEMAAFEEALDVVGIFFSGAEVGGDEVVLIGDEETGAAGIALAAGAAPQLVIDAAGFVAADAEDGEAAAFGGAGAEDDIDTATGHIGGKRDAADFAGAGDEGGFFGFVFSVEEVVGEMLKQGRELLRFFDGAGGDEEGLAGRVNAFDFGDDGLVLGGFGAEEAVGMVDPNVWAICGNDFDFKAVDEAELFGLGGGGAGHAGGEGVEGGEVLEGDGGEDAAFAAGRQGFFGFEGGVEAGGPASVAHGSAFVVVDGEDAGGGDEVIDVAAEEVVGVERVLESVEEVGVVVEIGGGEEGFGEVDAGVGEVDDLAVGFDVEVDVAEQGTGGEVGGGEVVGVLAGLAGDDEGDAGFIDEDGVGFVDDDGVEGALDGMLGEEGDGVSEVVEAAFVGGEIGDVGAVGGVAFRGGGVLGDGCYGEAEGLIGWGHPGGVAGGEVVVGGPDVDAVAVLGEGGDGGDGSDGFAFAGLHFDDFAGEEGFGGAELNGVEMEAEGMRDGFARGGESVLRHGFPLWGRRVARR